MSKNIEHTLSSGNVFADLGFDNAEELGMKSSVTILIKQLINKRGWTQKQAAEVLGIHQPDVSDLIRGKRLDHYSIERLINFLTRLNHRVTITIQDCDSNSVNSETVSVFVSNPQNKQVERRI